MLKPLRKRFDEKSREINIPLEIIEKDYLLSWILAGLYQIDGINSDLIFKGGTALKKCYFGQYRFSEDLDFTSISDQFKDQGYQEVVSHACSWAEDQLNEFIPIQISWKKYKEKQPHPEGQEAFSIYAQYPWQRQPLTKVMIEISQEEKILTPVESKKILHDYEEEISQNVQVYSLEEIVIEKLRAILQHTKKMHERDWSRSRARDFYDLWRIFNDKPELNTDRLSEKLKNKCIYKDVSFSKVEDFFDETMIDFVQSTWNKWLGNLVPNLPSSEKVITNLKTRLEGLIVG